MTMRREQTIYAPHECPECGEAAYIGMNNVECTYYKCRHFHEDTWQSHVMGLPDEGDPPDIDEDEPTQPYGLAAWLPDPKVKLDTAVKLATTRGLDELIERALFDCATSTTGSGLKAARDRHAELWRIKEEYDRARAEINKAIDTAPVPCYTVGHGPKRRS